MVSTYVGRLRPSHGLEGAHDTPYALEVVFLCLRQFFQLEHEPLKYIILTKKNHSIENFHLPYRLGLKITHR